MKIEHAAYQLKDPVAAAEWWVKHLGMTVKRSQRDSPFMHFLAFEGDAVMVEFYNNPKVPPPDHRALDPLIMHVAFRSDDVAADRARLIAAGATPEGEIAVTDAGDELAMLRDPWGFPIQLAKRKVPMIAG